MSALIFTDIALENLGGHPFEDKIPGGVATCHRWGPLAFRRVDEKKDELLAKQFDKVDFGTERDLHLYQCSAIERVSEKIYFNMYAGMHTCYALVPFACRYLRDGHYVAIHIGDEGWHPHYHPTINVTVSPEGIRDLQHGFLDMGGMFIFRPQGGTYEPLAIIFDQMCQDTPERSDWHTWMLPKKETTVGELVTRLGIRSDTVVILRPLDSQRDGMPFGNHSNIWELVHRDSAYKLGIVEGYRLYFKTSHGDPSAFGEMEPEVYIKLKP